VREQVGCVTQPNRAARLAAAIERDGPTCVWCGRPFGELVRPTTEHLVPRVKGGPSWLTNEVAACRRCNSARGHQAPALWLDECVRRGWHPDTERVVRVLTALDAEIAARGGQRRARPYIANQLRRLAPR
jgi:5-methylcytosine-specific restriction endonuclease McrA